MGNVGSTGSGVKISGAAGIKEHLLGAGVEGVFVSSHRSRGM